MTLLWPNVGCLSLLIMISHHKYVQSRLSEDQTPRPGSRPIPQPSNTAPLTIRSSRYSISRLSIALYSRMAWIIRRPTYCLADLRW
ncbi:hypothetical protein IW261DRAFT_458175 [Armillaria novae-zelandiae]|uniref:Secreted protein n=1 Tax=Armillaria novae-zelandiae TaxID=153914 RepID=A0AA39P2I4_9AGAR|nr:hypothetical protein IW261DRAFT_458175 [Armillaria novae-zelandiae]